MTLVTDLGAFDPEPIEFEGQMEPGVYFGLDEDAYHDAPAFSASGIKKELISPMDFWAASWMNPDREAYESRAMALGKAWHKRLLEGPDAFWQAYAAELDAEDYPEALRTMDDLRAALRELGEKTGGNKADLIARLQGLSDAPIWDVLVAAHAEAHAGKIFMSHEDIGRIEKQAAMIEKHPDISRCFQGGYPEVSVFWTDEESLVPMKARLDYVKIQADIDLKTFSNPLGKPLNRAIYTAMASGKYHVQVAVYSEAMRAAQAHIRAGRIFGDGDGAWLAKLARENMDDRQFVFVFQQTGPAPVARAYRFPRQLLTFDVGVSTMRQSQASFAAHWHRYGTDPWIDTTPLDDFTDDDFPMYMIQG